MPHFSVVGGGNFSVVGGGNFSVVGGGTLEECSRGSTNVSAGKDVEKVDLGAHIGRDRFWSER